VGLPTALLVQTGTGNVLTNDTDVDSVANGETQTVTAVSAGSIANPTGAVASSITGTYGSINIAATTGNHTYTVDNNNAAVQALRLSSQTLSETFTYRMSQPGKVAFDVLGNRHHYHPQGLQR
jgi:VCBS repeat-containing protein